MARVADILGIEQSALEGAFAQAIEAKSKIWAERHEGKFKFGFRNHCGFPRMGGPCVPEE